MNVLIACEFSGIVRDAFKARGHDAWSCDLLPTETKELSQHFICDIIELLTNGKIHTVWDLIILHPPCTNIGLCGNKHYGRGKPRHQERIAALDWTEHLWKLAISKSRRVALEQPKSTLVQRLGNKSQTIHPWQFGHMEQKETWLWLLGLPKLVPTNIVYDDMMKLPKRERERIFHMTPSPDRGHERSRTYQGIANAMAEQWGNL